MIPGGRFCGWVAEVEVIGLVVEGWGTSKSFLEVSSESFLLQSLSMGVAKAAEEAEHPSETVYPAPSREFR